MTARVWRISRCILIGVLIALLLLCCVTAGLLYYAWNTESGTQRVWHIASSLMGGRLQGELIGGRLNSGLALRNVIYHDATHDIRINHITGKWQIDLSPRKLTVTALDIGTVELRNAPTPPQPVGFPTRMTLPLALAIDRLAIEKLIVHQPGNDLILQELLAHGSSDGRLHKLTLERLQTPYGDAVADLTLEGVQPFALAGTLAIKGVIDQHAFNASSRLSGSLQATGVEISISGDQFDGTAQIAATAFSALPFERARIDIRGLNPKLFSASAPQAMLNIQADIRPQAEATASSGTRTHSSNDLSDLNVSGAISIVNQTPAPLDKGGLPIHSLDAFLRMNTRRQQLDDVRIELPNASTLRGNGDYFSEGVSKGQGQLTLNAGQLDLHALHTALRQTRLNGPLRIQLTPDTQNLSIHLADKDIDVKATARSTAQLLTIEKLTLQAGNGVIDLHGALERQGMQTFKLGGVLRSIDPARLLAMVAPEKRPANNAMQPGTADINLNLDLDGQLAEPLQGRLNFHILPSTYASLPLTGDGVLKVVGSRLMPSKASLNIAGNQLQLLGSFGQPGDRLQVHIDAPALDRLGYGVAGKLALDGAVAGSMQQPAIKATFDGSGLAYRGQSVTALHGNTDIAVNLQAGLADMKNRIQLVLHVAGLKSDQMRLSTLDIDLKGTVGAHRLQVTGEGDIRGEKLALQTTVAGGVVRAAGKDIQGGGPGYGWQGKIEKLENQGVPRILLASPWDIRLLPDDLTFGPAKLALAGTDIDLKSLTYKSGALRSAGAIDDLNIARLVDALHHLGISTPVLDNDLVLAAHWDFSLGRTASGFFEANRKSGDIHFDTGHSKVSLGLGALALRTDFSGQRAHSVLNVTASAVGSATATTDINMLSTESGMLLPTAASSLGGHIEATIPQLKNVAALAGPEVALEGQAKAVLALSGTLGDPHLSGDVTGDDLSVVSYDEGIALNRGVAHFRLDENLVQLKQLEFHGGSGTLNAVGQLQLGHTNPDLAVTVTADKLELFASPDRQLIMSGQAKIANQIDTLHVDGKFRVDRAVFDLPKNSAPKLGDDVVIVRSDNGRASLDYQTVQQRRRAREAKPANRFAPIMDITLDFGNDFQFHGSGADVQLGGDLNIKSGPDSPLKASGTINVLNGTYEVYGRKLTIEKGLINFQGPINNPNINILAMRRNQSVAAGAEITGTVAMPRVQLVSDPNVSDQEKLSWLMFGHGSDSTSFGQREAAGQALAALGNVGGRKIAKTVGLDEVSIGSSESGLTDSQVLNIGKALTEKITLGYEQGLTTAASVVKLTWQFSQRWSAVARGGTINGLAVQYNHRFD